jgi:hypothetical protein
MFEASKMRLLAGILIFIVWTTRSSYGDDFGTDYCPYMSLMTSSSDSIIYANIETSKFYVTTQSEHNGSKCEIPFNESSVCGVSVSKNQNWTKQWFVYWGFDEDCDRYYVRTVYYSKHTARKCDYDYQVIHHLHEDSVVFQVAYDGFTAYGFDYNHVYFYDLKLDRLPDVWPKTGSLAFTPCDISLTDTGNQAIAVGYLKDGNLPTSLMYATVCLWQLNWANRSIEILSCTRIHHAGYHFSKYHPGPKLSLDINNDKNAGLIVIGNSPGRSIEILRFNNTGITNMHTFQSHVETNSVCWLPDGRRIAAVAHLTSTPPWSQSQVQIYDFNLMIHDWPEYVFPNNQQQLDVWNFKNPVFILVSAWKQWNSLVILMNTEKVLVILSTAPGSYADPLLHNWFDNPWVWVGLRNIRHGEEFATPCWPGMYNEEDNILPCKICPPQTKSEANATTCSPCNQLLFCPLASVTDTNISDMMNIDEKPSYPKSSGSTEFEDILLSNMFSISSPSRCILISPLFWALIVISIVVLILLIIGILKFFPRIHKHRTMIKQIFRQTDFIGYGEFWIGGLMSFALFLFFLSYLVMNMLIFIHLKKLKIQKWLVIKRFEILNLSPVLNF